MREREMSQRLLTEETAHKRQLQGWRTAQILVLCCGVFAVAGVGGWAIGRYATPKHDGHDTSGHSPSPSPSHGPSPSPGPGPSPSPGPTPTPSYTSEYFKTKGFGGGGPPCQPAPDPNLVSSLFTNPAMVARVAAHPLFKKFLAGSSELVKTILPAQLAPLLGGKLPGISMVITLGNQIVLEEHNGLLRPLDASDTRVPDLDTAYQMGSVTKIFTTLAFFREQERKTLHGTSPLSDFLPDFSIHNPYSTANLTLNALASQTSGLPRAALCGNLNFCNGSIIVGSLKHQSLNFAPETQATYSNLGLALLGHATAAAAKTTSYEQHLVDTVLTPLGMNRSGFFGYPAVGARDPSVALAPVWPTGVDNQTIEDNMAYPHVASSSAGGKPTILPVPDSEWCFGWSNPGGGLTSTPRDISTFAMWALSSMSKAFNPAVASASTILSWLAPGHLLGGGLSAYGAGAWEHAYVNGTWVITKGGLAIGAGTQLALVPSMGLSVSMYFGWNTGIVPDTVTAEVTYGAIIALRAALAAMGHCANPLPATAANYLGSWGVGGATYLSLEAIDDSSCTVQASSAVLLATTKDSLVVTSAPEAAMDIEPGKIFEMLGVRANVTVTWAFHYNINDAAPPPVFQGNVACYLETALGYNANGYFLLVDGDERLWLPESFGSLLFVKF